MTGDFGSSCHESLVSSLQKSKTSSQEVIDFCCSVVSSVSSVVRSFLMGDFDSSYQFLTVLISITLCSLSGSSLMDDFGCSVAL